MMFRNISRMLPVARCLLKGPTTSATIKMAPIIRRQIHITSPSLSELKTDTKSRIQKIVTSDDVVLFMKGTPEEPMCGFSRNAKTILEFHEIKFKYYNVLEDPELREGIKTFSSWPTIPQVYVKGNFIGGADILLEMHKAGEITEVFDGHGIKTKFSEDSK